ncbi:hypothetical protein Dimus_028031 [Dionaea muscipula]
METKLISFLLGLTITCILLAPPTNGIADLRHQKKTQTNAGFSTELKHVDSGKNYLTKFERLQRAIERGNRRAKRIEAMILQAASTASSSSSQGGQGVQTPVSPGNGEYLMSVSIGTPPLPYQAIMDTGSDLIWTQCEPCTQCFNQSTPIYNPQGSSSFSQLSCSSQLCQDLAQQTNCSSDGTSCDYQYGYGDGSTTQGYLANETFTFGSESVPNIGFGCGTQNQGFQQGAGLFGMGHGPVSFPSQLGVNQFSYYLPGMDSSTATTQTGTLGLGSGANGTTTSSTVTTPLIQNSLIPTFYYINPTGISVAGQKLPIPASTFAMNGNGTGGMIIDSGTTLTYVVSSAYSPVKEAMISSTNLPTVNSSSTGLDLCFQLPQNTSNVQLPTMVFHFQGGDLQLPTANYFVLASPQVLCLAMGPMSGMSIYGNIFQQNTLVLYDTENWVLSLTPNY